jgi:kynurenine/2-aminoadipate aminotransferase
MIPLSGGLPNPSTFPFAEATFAMRDGSTMRLSGAAMDAALQYQPTNGFPPLVAQLRVLQERLHGVQPSQWNDKYDLVVSTGSQDGLCKALEMIMEQGDTAVVEEHTFFSTLSILNAYNANYIAVPSDQDGMRPDCLRQALQVSHGAWASSAKVTKILIRFRSTSFIAKFKADPIFSTKVSSFLVMDDFYSTQCLCIVLTYIERVLERPS